MDNLYNKLEAYYEEGVYPFHMPGHKRNMKNSPFEDMFHLDITEIDGFDNLHDAKGVIRDIEVKASKLYGSRHSFLSVNGSTAGILSAVSAVSFDKSILIAARNCHKSVFHAAFINRLEIEYIFPSYNKEFGFFNAVKKEEVCDAIIRAQKTGEKIAGVVITSPTYEGMVSEVKEIADLVHEFGLPLIVDEAHGAHFGFGEGFPKNSVFCDADIVVHSLHKTCPAPTQTALVHVGTDMVDAELVRKFLGVYETSSPSYILMAAIENCIDILASAQVRLFDELLLKRKNIESEISDLRHIKICPYTEPGKLVISVKGSNINGAQLADILRKQYKIEVEMAAYDYVLGILTIMDTEEGVERLTNALKDIDTKLSSVSESAGSIELPEPIKVIPYCKAFTQEGEYVDVDEAVGYISGDMVALYPPGSPILLPGEGITEEIRDIIVESLSAGLYVPGLENRKIKVLGKWVS